MELSGGEQQRVAIARALAGTDRDWSGPTNPPAHWTTETADSVMELLGDLHDDGLTLVLVTHDAEVGRSAPRLVRMVDGRIVEDRRRAPRRGRHPDAAGAGTVR